MRSKTKDWVYELMGLTMIAVAGFMTGYTRAAYFQGIAFTLTIILAIATINIKQKEAVE